ncbi:hypothetical protein GCK32_012219 [Trichostrongylus colubriformis]|uniref:Uncharacterized protein n=1 Tax=Trichostrongylus colubriformis TaxID=6319 RepID=A0AAN8IHD8_TRICO
MAHDVLSPRSSINRDVLFVAICKLKCEMSFNPTLISLLVLTFVNYLIEADFFSRLCLNPPQFATSNMTKTTTCILNLNIKTNERNVMELCKTVSPFKVIKTNDGYPTTCVYDKTFYCRESEEEFLGYCFIIKTTGKMFHRRGCGGRPYKLHVIQNIDEIKWVSVVFGERYKELWIGNSGTTAEHLGPIPETRPLFGGYRVNTVLSPIKLRLAKGGLDGIKAGTAVYGDRREMISYLCSRDANLYRETIKERDKEEGTFYEKFRVPHVYIPEKDGRKRLYIYYGTIHAVKGTEFKADVADLNKFCDLLPHGYAVRQEDFENVTHFREIVRKFTTMPVRVTARRSPVLRRKAKDVCDSEADTKAYSEEFSHITLGRHTVKKRSTERYQPALLG